MSKRRIQVMLDDPIAERIEHDAAKNHIGSSSFIRQIVCKYYADIDFITDSIMNGVGTPDNLKGLGTTSHLMEIAKKQTNNDEV